MSSVSTTAPGNLTTYIVSDVDVRPVAQYNITGGACVLYSVMIDNTTNSTDLFLKLYSETSGVTVGTTPQLQQYICKAGESVQYNIIDGLALAALTYAGVAGVKGAGSAVAGADRPQNAVKVYFAVT